MTERMLPALVTDAHSRAAVACLRALGRAGVPAIGMGTATAPGRWSRYATHRLRTGGGPLGARVAALAAVHGGAVVLPGQEEGIDDLLGARPGLPPTVVVPYGLTSSLAALRDKVALAAVADRSGLLSPRVVATGKPADLAAATPPAPAVVKARALSDALPVPLVCEHDDALRDALEELAARAPEEDFIIQERLSGRLRAVSLVLDREGRVAARFQQEALRTVPPHAGASSLARSVAPDHELVERAAGVLRAAEFWGMAQLQLLTADDGEPRLIDVNPRCYGSLPLALAAGVNLPLAWYAVAVGVAPPPERAYRSGVTYRWLAGELTAAYRGSTSHLRTGGIRPAAGAFWAADDPLPGLLLTGHWLRGVVANRLPVAWRERRHG